MKLSLNTEAKVVKQLNKYENFNNKQVTLNCEQEPIYSPPHKNQQLN